MDNLSEIVRGGTFCLAKAGLEIGGTTSQVAIDAPNSVGIDFAIKGVLYNKAEADDVFTLSGDIQTALYSCLYLLSLDKDGTAHCTQGKEVLTAAIGGTPLEWPVADADCCAIGAIRVDAGASAFTPGTTALTGGTVVVTYYDFFAVPDAPIVS